LTVADLANYMRAPVPDPGTQAAVDMQRELDTAVQEVTRATGMLDAVTVTVQVALDRNDSSLRLPYVRLASIGTVTDPGGVVVAPYNVDPLAGIVDLLYVGWSVTLGAWSVVCTGKAWPAALTTAALDWAAHLYDVHRTRAGAVDDNDQPPPSFALPNRVEELLRPYRLAGVA
jgi:hypothetical protein